MSIKKYKPEQIVRGKIMSVFAPSTISVAASNKGMSRGLTTLDGGSSEKSVSTQRTP